MKAQTDAAKIQQQGQIAQQKFQIDMAKLQTDERKIIADLHLGKESANVQLVKAMTERFSKQVDLQLKHKDLHHRHLKEAIETHHKVNHE